MIILVSGGLDSYIGYHYLKKLRKNVTPLFIDYRGSYTSKEKNVCRILFKDLIIDNSLNLHDLEKGEKAFIKNRNAYFALVASQYDTYIAMGGLKDDNVGDKSPLAFIKMAELLNTINEKTHYVFSPFWRKTKTDIIEWYLQNGYSINDLLQTTSCYDSILHFCGKCPSCFRKWCAFNSLGLSNHLPKFINKHLVRQYISEIKNYDPVRQDSIVKAAKIILEV